MPRFTRLKVLKEAAATRLDLVRDIESGLYAVEKSLIVNIDFQRRLFENEVSMLRRFNHRAIIRFLERVDGQRFRMEYASGSTLDEVISAGISADLALSIALRIVGALAWLHQLGFVHNDVKPSNIIVTKDQRIKLVDFAFCGKIGQPNFYRAPDYFAIGSDRFRPPQKRRRHGNSTENDIYACGVVLYQLFTSPDLQAVIEPGKLENSRLSALIVDCLSGRMTDMTLISRRLAEAGGGPAHR